MAESNDSRDFNEHFSNQTLKFSITKTTNQQHYAGEAENGEAEASEF